MILFIFLVHIPDPPSCSSPSLANRGYGSFFNGTSFSVGQPEICINYTYYHPICGNVTQQEAILMCYAAEYDYGRIV